MLLPSKNLLLTAVLFFPADLRAGVFPLSSGESELPLTSLAAGGDRVGSEGFLLDFGVPLAFLLTYDFGVPFEILEGRPRFLASRC